MTNDELKMLAAVEQKIKSNRYRLDKVEARQDNLDALITSVATLATEQEHMKKDVTEIKFDVKCLTERSGNDGMSWSTKSSGQ